jgi:hypothetical protein
MEEKNNIDAVPENQSGDALDVESVKDCLDISQANALFYKAKQRLLNVNQWHKVSGEALAHFTLTDQTGQPVSGLAQQGNLIKIDIPGPGTANADGFDWVIIEEIKEAGLPGAESIAIRVRPTADPQSDSGETAHFYAEQATSTFTLSQEHLRVTAGVYDRNLEPNQESTKLLDKLRNFVIGFAGKKGVSAVQWKAFADGLLFD